MIEQVKKIREMQDNRFTLEEIRRELGK